MSSVLKALKKIDRRKAETELPVWPYRIDNRESISRHTNRIWRRHRVLGILLVVCTIALAGKLFFGYRTDSESIPTEAGVSEKSTLPVAAGVDQKTERLRTLTDSGTGIKPAPAPPVVHHEASREPDLDTSPAETFPKAAVKAPETHQTAPKDNAGLTLQALVWAEQPEDRFVVINGSILREGGIINGSTIARIEPDYVSIRSGGTTWQLEYGQ